MPVRLLTTRRHSDGRGWFSETYSAERFAGAGIEPVFVQDNHSYSQRAMTLRGIHFQNPPHAQAKLVRCLRGRIYDVAVDMRRESPTFCDWTGAELSAEGGEQLYVPPGFGHAFLTLEADCEVSYKVDSYYAPQAESGICWNDARIAIVWPLGEIAPLLSKKDSLLPALDVALLDFPYDGQPLIPLAVQAV